MNSDIGRFAARFLLTVNYNTHFRKTIKRFCDVRFLSNSPFFFFSLSKLHCSICTWRARGSWTRVVFTELKSERTRPVDFLLKGGTQTRLEWFQHESTTVHCTPIVRKLQLTPPNNLWKMCWDNEWVKPYTSTNRFRTCKIVRYYCVRHDHRHWQ